MAHIDVAWKEPSEHEAMTFDGRILEVADGVTFEGAECPRCHGRLAVIPIGRGVVHILPKRGGILPRREGRRTRIMIRALRSEGRVEIACGCGHRHRGRPADVRIEGCGHRVELRFVER